MRGRRVEGCGTGRGRGWKVPQIRLWVCVPGDRMPVWGAPPENSSSAAFFCPALRPQVYTCSLGQVTQSAD